MTVEALAARPEPSDLSVIYGPPMAGKSTFITSNSELLHHVSLGKLCREEAEKDTPEGVMLRESIEHNTFLPSAFLLSLALSPGNLSAKKENVLDGYPKYEHEVVPLVEYCDANDLRLKKLYLIKPPLRALLDRLVDRYTCDPCYAPLKVDEQCPCSGTPYVREEDTEEYFRQRYGRFEQHAAAVTEELSKHCEEVVHVENY